MAPALLTPVCTMAAHQRLADGFEEGGKAECDCEALVNGTIAATDVQSLRT
jgi:hypothetical protein